MHTENTVPTALSATSQEACIRLQTFKKKNLTHEYTRIASKLACDGSRLLLYTVNLHCSKLILRALWLKYGISMCF